MAMPRPYYTTEEELQRLRESPTWQTWKKQMEEEGRMNFLGL